MDRRNFLKGLLALPFAPLAAKLLPKPLPKLSMLPGDVVYCPSGSDQTSIWMVDWGKPITAEEIRQRQAEQMRELEPALERLSNYNRNWLKESIRVH